MIEVIKADCRDFSVEMARECQALITDPPYSPHVHANITSAGTMGAGSRGWHRQDLAFKPLDASLQSYIAAFATATPGWSLIYSDHEACSGWRDAMLQAKLEYIRSVLAFQEHDAGCETRSGSEICTCGLWPQGYSGEVPWERWSQPQKSGDRPTQGFEIVSIFWGLADGRKIWNGPGTLTAFRHKCCRGNKKHRTQKPFDQALDMVSWFSNATHLPWAGAVHRSGRVFTCEPAQDPRAPVVDLCSGAGTIATACALLGRSCFATELDEKGEGWAEFGAYRATAAQAGTLSDNDREKAIEWYTATVARDEAAPEPKAPDGSDVKTWERAQRRLADANYVAERLGL